MNPLSGLPLDYLIGRDAPWDGTDRRITELPYDAEKAPTHGIGVKYCNLFDENNTGQYAPYLDDTDVSEAYGEGVIDPAGPGWEKNLAEQFGRALAQGFEYIELDNCDAYQIKDVLGAIKAAGEAGLKVIAKNPGIMNGDETAIVAHPNVYGIIVEKGAGGCGEMDRLRKQANKPDFPVWFVFYGDGRFSANATADAIRATGYLNMGVTYSSEGEYGNAIHIFLPVTTKSPSMAWRVAKSLLTLLGQVNALAPGRDRSSDGTIGDAAHAASTSDHNPNAANVVTALDITHDPAHLVDARKLAETLVASRDERIKYIISNAQIISSKVSPWQWRPYTGANAHREHVHISVMGEPELYDDPSQWQIGPVTPQEPGWDSGKGSWYSWYEGKYSWKDEGDKPNSNVLGVPDDQQGVAFYQHDSLGDWFDVRAPNGKVLRLRHTEVGPHPSTGRTIDIAAVRAEQFGYSPHYVKNPADPHFPTDGVFSWRPAVDRPVDPPRPPVPVPIPVPTPPANIAAEFDKLRAMLMAVDGQVDRLEKAVTAQASAPAPNVKVADALDQISNLLREVGNIQPGPITTPITTEKAPLMNNEQLKSIVRSALIALGSLVAGWAASKGWANAETITSLLTNETVIGIVAAVAAAWWGVNNKTNANMIVSASNVPDVKSVTVDNAKLAKQVEANGADANIVVRQS